MLFLRREQLGKNIQVKGGGDTSYFLLAALFYFNSVLTYISFYTCAGLHPALYD